MNLTKSLLIILLCSSFVSAQAVATPNAGPTLRAANRRQPLSPTDKTARYLESLRKSPPQELAFLLKMPKGADLHSHLSGAVYAESYIQWAADNGLCVNNTTMALSLPPCNAGQSGANSALTNSLLY